MRVEFFPIDLMYRIIDGRATLLLFGPTRDGKRVCVLDSTFEPYFYCEDKNGLRDRVAKLVVNKGQDAEARVVSVKPIKKRLFGKERSLLRVVANVPKAVPVLAKHIREEFEAQSFEADIPFVRRYLIDKGFAPLTLLRVDGEHVSSPRGEGFRVPVVRATRIEPSQGLEVLNEPRVLAFDIETYSPDKRYAPEEQSILMISLYGKDFQRVLTWKPIDKDSPLDYVEVLRSEADVLMRFKELVEEYAPDILTGYFSDGFDLPFIKTRARKYRIKLDLGLDHSDLKTEGRIQSKASIVGIAHIDIFKFIRTVVARSLQAETLDLNSVANELLHAQKHDVPIEGLVPAWDAGKGLSAYAKYCLIDSQLCYDLCVKLWPNLLELVRIVGCLPPFDVCRTGFSQFVELYVMRQAQGLNEIAPNKPTYTEQRARLQRSVKGGFVAEPKPGLYQNLAVLDFRSLYPSIIASHNVSPDVMNCRCCTDAPRAPTERGTWWFCQKQKGFLSSVIEDLISRRARIKDMLKREKDPLLEARSEALKVLANSFYGYLGFAMARWYSVECAECTTAWGRDYITRVNKDAEQRGFRVLYNDTDSTFIAMERKSRADVQQFLFDVNKSLPGIMELELEGYYPVGLFVSLRSAETGAKKKYALLNEQGEIKVRGFETVRRNASVISRELQRYVLEHVLHDRSVDKALTHVQDVVSQLQKNQLPIDKVIISTQIQKDIDSYASPGPPVAAAKRLRDRGMPVGAGDTIRFVVVKGKGLIRDKVRLPEEVNANEYDSEYYITHHVLPAVEKIFAALGVTKEQMLGAMESQAGLAAYFKPTPTPSRSPSKSTIKTKTTTKTMNKTSHHVTKKKQKKRLL